MKITKKEFITIMSAYPVICLGTTRKLYLDSELECKISDILNQSPKDRELMEHRNYTAHSTYLESDNGSRLYLDKCVFHKESVGMGETVLICERTEIDSFDSFEFNFVAENKICMYYLVDYANTTVKGL